MHLSRPNIRRLKWSLKMPANIENKHCSQELFLIAAPSTSSVTSDADRDLEINEALSKENKFSLEETNELDFKGDGRLSAKGKLGRVLRTLSGLKSPRCSKPRKAARSPADYKSNKNSRSRRHSRSPRVSRSKQTSRLQADSKPRRKMVVLRYSRSPSVSWVRSLRSPAGSGSRRHSKSPVEYRSTRILRSTVDSKSRRNELALRYSRSLSDSQRKRSFRSPAGSRSRRITTLLRYSRSSSRSKSRKRLRSPTYSRPRRNPRSPVNCRSRRASKSPTDSRSRRNTRSQRYARSPSDTTSSGSCLSSQGRSTTRRKQSRRNSRSHPSSTRGNHCAKHIDTSGSTKETRCSGSTSEGEIRDGKVRRRPASRKKWPRTKPSQYCTKSWSSSESESTSSFDMEGHRSRSWQPPRKDKDAEDCPKGNVRNGRRILGKNKRPFAEACFSIKRTIVNDFAVKGRREKPEIKYRKRHTIKANSSTVINSDQYNSQLLNTFLEALSALEKKSKGHAREDYSGSSEEVEYVILSDDSTDLDATSPQRPSNETSSLESVIGTEFGSSQDRSKICNTEITSPKAVTSVAIGPERQEILINPAYTSCPITQIGSSLSDHGSLEDSRTQRNHCLQLLSTLEENFDDQGPVETLQRICEAMGWDQPTYFCQGNNPQLCQCQMIVNGKIYGPYGYHVESAARSNAALNCIHGIKSEAQVHLRALNFGD